MVSTAFLTLNRQHYECGCTPSLPDVQSQMEVYYSSFLSCLCKKGKRALPPAYLIALRIQ